ncbi:MAG TPA: alpha/beta hydrolase [Streptosporangiaceae bacterium]|nr:alpha/beta hydrolase [Streptosporangiaceae bacterium]
MQAPLSELTVREKGIGGRVIEVVRWRGLDPRDRFKNPRLLILVHGFNMAQGRAADELSGFHRRLAGCSSSARPLPPAWMFYWPGDHEIRSLSATTYSVRVPVAERAGERLGRLLTELSPSQRVILVGHSLGCRVVLEALNYVANERARGTPSAEVTLACLMAAAVPQGRCQGGGQPYRGEVIKNPVHIMFSRNDCVLRGVFPLGQKVNGEDMGPAVGYLGGPPGRWEQPPHETDLGHGGYLTATRSANAVAKIIDGTIPQAMPARKLPRRICLAMPHGLRKRQLASRAVGDQDVGWTDCWPTAGQVPG